MASPKTIQQLTAALHIDYQAKKLFNAAYENNYNNKEFDLNTHIRSIEAAIVLFKLADKME